MEDLTWVFMLQYRRVHNRIQCMLEIWLLFVRSQVFSYLHRLEDADDVVTYNTSLSRGQSITQRGSEELLPYYYYYLKCCFEIQIFLARWAADFLILRHRQK